MNKEENIDYINSIHNSYIKELQKQDEYIKQLQQENQKYKEIINKAIELTKNLLKTEDRGYYQILFKEILKSLGDKE